MEPFYKKIWFLKLQHYFYITLILGVICFALLLAFELCEELYFNQKSYQNEENSTQTYPSEEEVNKSLEYLEK